MIVNLFGGWRIPSQLPKDMQKVVEGLRKTKSREECLKKAYNVFVTQFHGCKLRQHVKTYFSKDVKRMWRERDTHCTNLNYLLYILLLKSGKFRKEDIKFRWTLASYISPHQYIEVRVSKSKVVKADPYGASRGIKLGELFYGKRAFKSYFFD